MNLVIYSSENTFFPTLNENFFLRFDVKAVFEEDHEYDYLFKTNKEEFWLNLITEKLDILKLNGISTIIIDKSLGGSGWERAANLAGHIACTIFQFSELENKTIILTDSSELNIEDSSLKRLSIDNLFQTPGIYFRKYEQLFSSRLNPLTTEVAYAINEEAKRLKPITFNELSIRNAHDSSHQSTNEWGAIKMASNFGIDSSSLKFKWPKHLYFKYLIKSLKQGELTSSNLISHGLFKKVLLIDDNANNGWQEVLQMILGCSVDIKISASEINILQNVNPEKCKEYDLILLDLYLHNNSDSSKALSLLSFLKSKFPEIPIVIFTASNKAWNLREIVDRGADGMYIKESPSQFRNEQFSRDNTSHFVDVLKKVQQKYRILKPFWLQIQAIQSSQKFLTIDNSPKVIRDRISERLIMFWGLLKKGYDQTKYDKHCFYYSEYELAFMTLWSVLNEIQEAYYDKNDQTPITDLVDESGNIILDLNGSPILPISKFNWFIKDQSEFLMKHKFKFAEFDKNTGLPKTITNASGEHYYLKSEAVTTYLEFNNSTPPYYLNGQSNRSNISRELHNQIAFLILNKNALKNWPNKDSYLSSFKKMNDIRNHLYLTHGETSHNYYKFTEEDKRDRSDYQLRPEYEIKELFELIGFLLTNTNTTVHFE